MYKLIKIVGIYILYYNYTLYLLYTFYLFGILSKPCHLTTEYLLYYAAVVLI